MTPFYLPYSVILASRPNITASEFTN